MSKKSKTNQKHLPSMVSDQTRKQLETSEQHWTNVEVKTFFNDVSQDNISSSYVSLSPASLIEIAKNPPPGQNQMPFLPYPNSQSPYSLGLTQYQLQDRLRKYCSLIREDVASGKLYNIEIQLNRGRQMYHRREFPLGDTVVKMQLTGTDEPMCFFIKAGVTPDVSIFLGETLGLGIILIRDDNGNDHYLRLSVLHMLSLRDSPTLHGEMALTTSFSWAAGKVRSCVVHASSLDPIKMLFLSDQFQAGWQRIKDAATEPLNKEIGGESNEQKQLKS